MRKRTADRLDQQWVPQSWWVRRKVWLGLVTLVPMLLIGYSLIATLVVRSGNLLRGDASLVFTAIAITAVSAFVIWDVLSAMVRIKVSPRRVLSPVGRQI